MNADSKGWRMYAYASFAVSLAMMILGVLAIPGELWMKGFFLVGTFFLTGACFTLAKTMRDQHESENLVHKLENAKAERILREFESSRGTRAVK
ncbi:MAG: YiaA/YiaB family inner membrane protein [Hyphomicrobiaceae bacterium]